MVGGYSRSGEFGHLSISPEVTPTFRVAEENEVDPLRLEAVAQAVQPAEPRVVSAFLRTASHTSACRRPFQARQEKPRRLSAQQAGQPAPPALWCVVLKPSRRKAPPAIEECAFCVTILRHGRLSRPINNKTTCSRSRGLDGTVARILRLRSRSISTVLRGIRDLAGLHYPAWAGSKSGRI